MNLMINWKTSLAGIGVILPALIHLLTALSSGQSADLTTDISAIIAGIGLIFAKDGTTHSTMAEVKESTAEEKK